MKRFYLFIIPGGSSSKNSDVSASPEGSVALRLDGSSTLSMGVWVTCEVGGGDGR